MKPRPIEVLQDDGGLRLAIPLGPDGIKGTAVIDPADYDHLVKLGLSQSWNVSRDGYVTAPCYRAPGNQVLVVRVLLNCEPGEFVTYKNRDKRDLRRSNLIKRDYGYSKHNPRQFIKTKEL